MQQITLEQAMQIAKGHHQAGRVAEAEKLYRQVLSIKPDHADAMHFLGLLAGQTGKIELALELIQKSLSIMPNNPGYHLNHGSTLHTSGRLDEAAAAFLKAIQLRPGMAGAHLNLGNVYRDQNKLDEAAACYQQVLKIAPNQPDAYVNLGVICREKNMLPESEAYSQKALKLVPGHPKALVNIGAIVKEQGNLDRAIAIYQQAIQSDPNDSSTWNHLALALYERGKIEEAIAACQKALSINPNFDEACITMGLICKSRGQIDQAINYYNKAITLRPGTPMAHNNLALALKERGRYDEALASCKKALELKPDLAGAHSNLGLIYKDMGLLDVAIESFRKAIELDTRLVLAHDNLLMTLQYHPDTTPAMQYAESRVWNRLHASHLYEKIKPHANDKNPDRKLKIGYLSSDFKNHPVGRFILPLLENHDQSNFEIFCYSHVAKSDDLTEKLKSSAHHWRNIIGMTDTEIVQLIRKDQIDILIDLAVHSADNRLTVFAYKPAPIQMTYLGSPDGTGLDSIDYRISDQYFDADPDYHEYFAEESIWLPRTYWCYQPSAAMPEVGELPSISAGHITFGCLNNFCKVTLPTLDAYARIMQQVPGSRLILRCYPGSHQKRLLQIFADKGITSDRIELVGWVPVNKFFNLYNRIDIALDPFPYNGGTTTCDATWMGVPVITLAGKTAVGRAGVSTLSTLGLHELIAEGVDAYIQKAIALASDSQQVERYRSTLRDRMKNSPMTDAPGFARDIETAYRIAWRKWCNQK